MPIWKLSIMVGLVATLLWVLTMVTVESLVVRPDTHRQMTFDQVLDATLEAELANQSNSMLQAARLTRLGCFLVALVGFVSGLMLWLTSDSQNKGGPIPSEEDLIPVGIPVGIPVTSRKSIAIHGAPATHACSRGSDNQKQQTDRRTIGERATGALALPFILALNAFNLILQFGYWIVPGVAFYQWMFLGKPLWLAGLILILGNVVLALLQYALLGVIFVVGHCLPSEESLEDSGLAGD